jgi:hypothetical protein
MSFSGKQTQQFLEPLTGGTTTFLLEKRATNLQFARTTMWLLTRGGNSCAIFDLDALYSSNSDRIFAPLAAAATSIVIRVPAPGSNIQEEVSRLFEVRQKILIIDSLNTFYHLMMLEDGNSRSRNIAFAVEALSYLARTNGKAVFITMYRRLGFPRRDTGRSIASLSDSTVSVDIRGDELKLRNDRGAAWPGGTCSIRIP